MGIDTSWEKAPAGLERRGKNAPRGRAHGVVGEHTLLIAVVVPASVLLCAHLRLSTRKFEDENALWTGLVVLPGFLPTLAAFAVIIAEGRAYREHGHAYAGAGQVFELAVEVAEKLHHNDAVGRRELALPLGIHALDENAAWLENHRERHIESKRPA